MILLCKRAERRRCPRPLRTWGAFPRLARRRKRRSAGIAAGAPLR